MTSPSETHSIVIVDDVPEIREILGFLLEESGWFRVVGEAGTGDQAVDVVEKCQPEVLLLDLDLPGMTGWDVLPLVHERAPTTAVVVLTSSIDEVEPARADVAALANAVVQKGSPNRELINALLEVIGRTRFTHTPDTPRSDRPPVELHAGWDDAGGWLEALVTSSADAVIGTACDGRIVLWNAAAERLYGYAADEAIGRSIRMLFPADRPDDEVSLLGTVLAGEHVESYETVRFHKDGSRLDIQLGASPVRDRNGTIVGAIGVSRSINSRRQTEAALARAMVQLERRNRELMRSNEELDTFAAVASHDLAQPLQVAYGFLDMLRADFGDSLPDPGPQWLDRSIAGLDRMRNLVRDILRYARSGSGEPQVELVTLGDVVADALSSLEITIESRGAKVDVAPDLPIVAADRGQLALVMQNLIANAIKFVPSTRTPAVSVTAERVDGAVVVRVADNGQGIPQEERAKVFEMFQRSSGSGGIAGTGLGLAIVKKIVARHGGAAWIEDGMDVGDGEGTGTTVAVRLPAPEPGGVLASP